ncbi:uncharacterized protein LOC119466155 [Dermacentor silvarum]|uniref:uncharacterized protein LOC119466155 n=1 Tax=Dermacentor silvarum TaxID=543639 RepID=UPI002100C876|nr:uncharacterized protein LOC119466155 [Dermacentor silvarum]
MCRVCLQDREKTGNKLFLLPDVRLSCFANDRHLLHQMFSEMNDEMSRISDPLSPIPEAPDNTEMIEQELRECTGIGFAKAIDCTLKKELGEAIRTCEIFRQRVEVLLAEAAELSRLLEQAAETDSDETGSARTSSG